MRQLIRQCTDMNDKLGDPGTVSGMLRHVLFLVAIPAVAAPPGPTSSRSGTGMRAAGEKSQYRRTGTRFHPPVG